LRGFLQADLFDLVLDGGDDDLQQVLPAGTLQAPGQSARNEQRANDQHQHQAPGKQDGRVKLEKAVLPENHVRQG
jgi:hypothetical protein